jgi:hypothetical protein
VKTATIPGIAAAFDVSMPSIFACAYGLRTTAIHAMPGAVRLSV